MPLTTSVPYLSLGELADLLSVQSWRIARLFELGILQEPQRVSGRRLIPKTMVPQVVDSLKSRGWLPESPEVDPEKDEKDISRGLAPRNAPS